MKELTSEKTQICTDQRASTKIDPMDHVGFAYRYANKYISQGARMGYSLKDLEQVAMVGICEAAKGYSESKGAFTTYAGYHLKNELNKLVYRTTGTGRKLRQPDVLFCEVVTIDDDGDEFNPFLSDERAENVHEDTTEDDIYLQEFIETINVVPRDKELLIEIMNHGRTQATKNMMKRFKLSRQAIQDRIYKIRERVKSHLVNTQTPTMDLYANTI